MAYFCPRQLICALLLALMPQSCLAPRQCSHGFGNRAAFLTAVDVLTAAGVGAAAKPETVNVFAAASVAAAAVAGFPPVSLRELCLDCFLPADDVLVAAGVVAAVVADVDAADIGVAGISELEPEAIRES